MKTRTSIIIPTVMFFAVFGIVIFVNDVGEEEIGDPEPKMSDSREDLIDVFHSNNLCSKTYRGDLSDMMHDKNYDYKNDTTFQECTKMLKLERHSGTVYSPNQKQMETILEYCTDPRDITDAKSLSYSNYTHHIDTVTCEWMKFKGNEIPRPDLLP